MKNSLFKLVLAGSLITSGVPLRTEAGSVNDSADQTSDANTVGQAMSYVTGGLYITVGTQNISAGSSPCFSHGNCGKFLQGVMEVMLGMLSLQQGGADGKTASSAALTGFNTDGLGTSYGVADTNPEVSAILKAAQDDLAKLEKAGIINTKDGTATVNGKTYSLSDVSSDSAMAAAGLSQSNIDSLKSLNAAIEKKAAEKVEKMKLGSATATNGFEEGGGGSLKGPDSLASSESDGFSSAALAGRSKVGIDRDPSALAGMQKNYNGEPIGVAADSIFLMMSRRYKVKESQESFYTDAELALKK
ncbi:MAG: hypothetical protein AAGB31_10165 [Bdellovibrio sp.]